MTNEIIRFQNEPKTDLVEHKPTETPLTDEALENILASKSENTIKNYQHSLELFRKYMLEHYDLDIAKLENCIQVNQRMIANYLSYLGGDKRSNEKNEKKLKPLKASSVLRHLSALRWFFDHVVERINEINEGKKPEEKIAFQNPTRGKKIDDTIEGLQRRKGTAPKRKRAITYDVVSMILAEIDMKDLKDLRDAALIAFGFAGALRRSELANVDVEHLHFKDSGIMLYLPKSKTDQKGEGMWKHIAYGERKNTCPVRLVQQWMKAAGITEGPLFRNIRKGGNIGDRITPHSIARIIKERAKAAGLDSEQFSGHSLRRGYITHAYDHGLDLFTIMQHSGHESVETVKKYVEMIDVERKSATKGLY